MEDGAFHAVSAVYVGGANVDPGRECVANVTVHHNLYSHCVSRVARADFHNNVLYDWGHAAGYGQFEQVNDIANILKPGPSTTQRPPQFHNGDELFAAAESWSRYGLAADLTKSGCVKNDTPTRSEFLRSALPYVAFNLLA